MTAMFQGASEFDGDILSWDTAGVTDMTDITKRGILGGIFFIQLTP